MAFDYDELNPLGSTYLADYPANEQGHRAAVLNSSNVDHYPEDGPIDSQSGFHRQLSLPPLGEDPTPVGDAGFVYTKDVDGITELFYLNEDGQDVVQLTSDGTASPDKLPLAGGTLIGGLIIEAADLTVNDGDILPTGTTLIKLLNTLYLQGRDQADAAFRDLIGVNASDEVEIGDSQLAALVRAYIDDVDGLKVYYSGGEETVWNTGHFDAVPLLQNAYVSPLQAIDGGNYGGFSHGIAGGTPDLWTAVLRANATDRDYASGEEIPVMAGLSPEDTGQTSSWISVNSTASRFEWRRSNSNPNIFNGTGGATDYALDDSKWDLVYKAWY
jgi:hypothetical protein